MLHDLATFDPDMPDELCSPNAPSAWTRAREDYQAGESASAVCERYRLSRSVFFKRAKEEGWRKRDAPGSAPDPDADDMEAALVADMLLRPATPAYALARRAWALAEVALMRRRRLEAMSWVRVAKELRKLAMEEAGGQTWRRTAQLAEEATAAKAQAIPEPDEDSAFEGPLPEGSSPLPQSGGGGGEADGGGDADEPQAVEAPTPSSISPPPPQERSPSPADAGEEKKAERDDGLLPMSTAANPRKLKAFLKAEFGWPRDPADSADQSARTAPLILPIPDGEVAAQ